MTGSNRKLGRYELIRCMAKGGMGEIYLARTRGAGGFEKLVIIKTILPHLAEEEEFVTKFLDEGRIVVQLTHGNIVPVFDMGEQNGEYFIAMEYVPGLDLRAIIKHLRTWDEPLSVEVTLYVAAEVCKGLGYAHRKVDDQGNPLNIVHRDVSPSNVLISREGEVKIIDFGIARAAGKVAKTMTGRIQGKCCYMSPEQSRGKSLDARSDIFSAGVLLYEMLTLVRPFEGRSDLESLELVRQCQFDPPSVLRPTIPDGVDEIVERAMAPHPEDRYQTADELFVDLQEQIYSLGSAVTSQRLVDSLQRVFDAESAADEATPDSPRPANLDEALELELARLDSDSDATPTSLPSTPYALSPTDPDTGANTRTLGPTPATPHHALGPSPESSTYPPLAGTGTGTGTGTNSNHPSGPDSASHSALLAPGLNTAEYAAITPRRQKVAMALLAMITVAAVGLATYLLLPPKEGTLELITEPSGAQIYLDGDELAGQRTPVTLSLPPSTYGVELILEDYRPRQFRVDIAPGSTVRLDADDLRMLPLHEAPRTFTITTDPGDATLIADGQALGHAPQQIELRPDEVINLSARAPECSAIFYALHFGHERDDIHLELECTRTPDDDLDPEGTDDDPPPRSSDRPAARDEIRQPRSTQRAVRIDSAPSGAEILIDGETIGQSPVFARLRRGREVAIEARHDGFEPYMTTVRPDDLDDDGLSLRLRERPRGCLDFRAVYPAHNEIAINGQWLDGRHMALQNHRLPAGTNTITVRHPESEREESFEITISPGTDCTVLTVWEPE